MIRVLLKSAICPQVRPILTIPVFLIRCPSSN